MEEVERSNTMNMLEWAKKEVEIACTRENPYRKEGEFDYGCACYESALNAYESLCGDGHSGASIGITKAILNRLVDGRPLTPIEDTDEIWKITPRSVNIPYKVYQCTRMTSLFKYVYNDGLIKYTDVDRCYCKDINNPKASYTSGLSRKIIDEMFPITMPYYPVSPIVVFCEDFCTDMSHGDFDTVGLLYLLKYDKAGEQQHIDINRFFREPFSENESGWIEISKEEYETLKAMRIN